MQKHDNIDNARSLQGRSRQFGISWYNYVSKELGHKCLDSL